MQKFIRTMAIIATALIALSLFLLLFTIPFQRLIAKEFYGMEEALSALPQFPVIPFIFCLLRLACVALLIICCGNKRGGIWLELIVFFSLLMVLPFLNSIISTAYTTLLARMGVLRLTANNYVSMIANYCLQPASWGGALAYAVCGMSIIYKHMCKKIPACQETER